MFIEALTPLFQRDLQRLKDEIHAFPDGQALWRVNGTITNSAGNLCLHLCGNLQHFIGAVLGNTGFERDRDTEFAKRDVPAAALIAEIERTMDVVSVALKRLNDEDMAKPFPVKVFADELSTAQFLMHLQGHLNYHLGQINYLRRMG